MRLVLFSTGGAHHSNGLMSNILRGSLKVYNKVKVIRRSTLTNQRVKRSDHHSGSFETSMRLLRTLKRNFIGSSLPIWEKRQRLHLYWRTWDHTDTAYGAPKDTWINQEFGVFGYLTRVILLVPKTSSSERNGKPRIRPPATWKSYQPCWKWSSLLGTLSALFLRHCFIYMQLLRVLYRYRYLRYETKLSTANHIWRLYNYTYCSQYFPRIRSSFTWKYLLITFL